MTPQQIRDAIAASAELTAMQAAGNTQGIADALSVGLTRVVSRMVSARGLSERLPGGPLAAEVILMKLEGARDALLASPVPADQVTGSLLRRQLKFLDADGLDFGSPALRAMLDQFTPNPLTAQEVADLKSIALEPHVITHTDVGAAIQGA